MKILKILSFLALFLICSDSYAQQMGQYSQYMMNYYLINPAAGGVDNVIDLRAGYRIQWLGLSGSPRNYYVTGHMPFGRLNTERVRRRNNNGHHVIGAIFSGQQLGALTHNNTYLTYGYHLPISGKWIASLALSGGINQFHLNKSALDFGDYIPDAAASTERISNFDLGGGLWIYSEKIFTGLSSHQILQPGISFAEGIPGKGMLNRIYMFTVGYKIRVQKDYLIIPSILLKQTTTALQADLNTKIKFRDFIWAGISYRRIDAFAALAGISVPIGEIQGGKNYSCTRLEIGYSYDLGTSRLRNHHSGTHEIVVALLLPKKSALVCPSHFW